MIRFEPATASDLPFAWGLYRATIGPLAKALGAWQEGEERRVVEQSFADEQAEVILVADRRVGWLHVRITSRALELWQIFISEEHRGRGLGSGVLRQLQSRATELGRPILLAVLRNNPAVRLYSRLGFVLREEGPHHLFLWWIPSMR